MIKFGELCTVKHILIHHTRQGRKSVYFNGTPQPSQLVTAFEEQFSAYRDTFRFDDFITMINYWDGKSECIAVAGVQIGLIKVQDLMDPETIVHES